MAEKVKICFAFPADALDGIYDSFAEGRQEFVVVDGEAVPNPVSKADFCHTKVMEYIATIWASYAAKKAMADTEAAVKAAVAQRVDEVKAATEITVEEFSE